IKVLPASVSGDADRVRRFEQEARAAGVLNHPCITAVHDIGSHEGSTYVVSELLEGETLRSRTGGGALSLRRAVDYALQIARGLAAAHEKGIVHRDLKPENLFVTNDGRVKILDFGLAKLTQREAGGGPQTNLPTASAGTEPGMVMGTLGYMSPEQVRGKPADARSDIFSFGAILYEMLSGKRAFHGDSAADTMSAILREDPPDLSATNVDVPPGLDRIVRHCLEKSPEQRFHSAHDLAFDLEALSTASGGAATGAVVSRRSAARSSFPLSLIGAVAGAIAGVLLAGRLMRTPAPGAPILSFLTFSGDDWAPSASPDGKLVAFVSDRDGTSRIWLKELAGGNEVALTSGPDEAPRFSPDGATIFFLRRDGHTPTPTLFRVPVVGGEPRRVRQNSPGAAVSPDGRLIAVTDFPLPGPQRRPTLSVAPADGTGSPRPLARFEGGAVLSPKWSPDGRRIAAIHQDLGASAIPARLVVLDVDSGEQEAIVPAKAGLLGVVEWDPSGESLLYTQMDAVSTADLSGVGRLFRHDLESRKHTLLVSFPRTIGFAALTIAGRGRLILDADASNENLLEASLSERIPPRYLTHGSATDRQPAYSPDGEWVVVSSTRGGNWDLWQVSRRTGAVRRLTDHPRHDWDPAFTPDGKRLLWSSNRTGHFEIWVAEADGSAPRQLTRDGVGAENPTATSDGQWVVYDSRNPKHPGLCIVRSDGSSPRRLVQGPTVHSEVSPDGKHALYFVFSPGSNLMRVVELPGGAPARFEIPGLMGNRARWMPDGRRIAFLHQNEKRRMGVFVQDFVPGTNTMASRRVLAGFDPTLHTESFGVSPDGSH
ncbi:MAG TPA: protein kinase, partial [Thermoanaerobaculia bacterium]|nr:protein kinase [Thermoanaerobaculia bacterium]